MKIIILFSLFLCLLISGIYPVKAQFARDNEQQICKGVNVVIDTNISNDLYEHYVTDKQIFQEKQNLFFMINLAMRSVSNNNAEQDMRKNKDFCDSLDFSVAKVIFPPYGFDHINCMKNTLQLDFSHSNKKVFSIWDQAIISYNLKPEANEYQRRIKLTPQDFIDVLNLQFINKEKHRSRFKNTPPFYYEFNYQWKLDSSIKLSFSVAEHTFLEDKQYPEYINFINIVREDNTKY